VNSIAIVFSIVIIVMLGEDYFEQPFNDKDLIDRLTRKQVFEQSQAFEHGSCACLRTHPRH